jgi:hypothetical protein
LLEVLLHVLLIFDGHFIAADFAARFGVRGILR